MMVKAMMRRSFLFIFTFLFSMAPVSAADDVGRDHPRCGAFRSALVLAKPGRLDEITSAGITIDSIAGDVLSVRAPECSLNTLNTNPNVRAISGLKSFRIMLDESSRDVGLTDVRERLPNGEFVGATGKGVLIGVVDSGIDWQHPDFRSSDGTTRITHLWDPADDSYQASGGAIGSAPPVGLEGTVYLATDINSALQARGVVNSSDGCGHGTHVAGIAAGNGAADSATYPAGTFVGAAPESGLIVVRVFDDQCSFLIDDVNLVQAMAFIDQAANELDQPYVINMSLGTQVGAHDGTDLEELAIDSLTGPGTTGKAVVVSAGNDGDAPVHVSGSFGSPGAANQHIVIDIDQPNPDQAAFNFWFDGRDQFRVLLEGGGRTTEDITSQVRFSPLTGSKQLLFVSDRTPGFRVRIVGESVQNGRFDGWLEGNARFVSQVDRTGLISIPGTARQAVTVGAYTTKVSWLDGSGKPWMIRGAQIGEAADFTSPGPTRDGRLKPELSAPGQVIASSLSSNAGVALFPDPLVLAGRQYAIAQGTSMSAPHVAGTIALLFEETPGLDSALAKELLRNAARSDQHTGSVPNLTFGAGKLDVAALLEPQSPRVAISLDQPVRVVGEVVNLWFATQEADIGNQIDGWIALAGPDGVFRFLDPGTEQFDVFPIPYRTDFTVTDDAGLLFSGRLTSDLPAGKYVIYALGVAPGGAPFDTANWVTNLAATELKILD